jgi:integrase
MAGSVELSQKLDTIKANMIKAYRELTADQDKRVTFEQITEVVKAAIDDRKPVAREKDIFSFYKEFIEHKAQFNRKGTLKEYWNVFHALVEFNDMHSYGLTFEKVDMRFYDKFLYYLTSEKKNIQSGAIGLRNDTIGKYIATLKLFLTWALERGYHNTTTYQSKSFAPYPFRRDRQQRQQSAKVEIVTITLEELKHLEAFDLSKDPRKERVRDLFVFGCYTGQRWSDIENYSPEDIKNNAWEFEAHKTTKFTRVPFVGYCSGALPVLQKYEYNLPKMTNQEMNRTLKEVFKAAGLSRKVTIRRYIGNKEIPICKPLHDFATTHMARRTAVTMLLESGMSMLMVMKLTNHSDTRTLLKYENAGQEALEEALRNGETKQDNIRKIS